MINFLFINTMDALSCHSFWRMFDVINVGLFPLPFALQLCNSFHHLLTFSPTVSRKVKRFSCRPRTLGSCLVFVQLLNAFWLDFNIYIIGKSPFTSCSLAALYIFVFISGFVFCQLILFCVDSFFSPSGFHKHCRYSLVSGGLHTKNYFKWPPNFDLTHKCLGVFSSPTFMFFDVNIYNFS